MNEIQKFQMTWREQLNSCLGGDQKLLNEGFMDRSGDDIWSPNGNDGKAAGMLHTQIISRVISQPLNYLDGIETTALASIYSLFEKTREICDAHHCAIHFKTIAWDVLNTHVRPFTAKWHAVAASGNLNALDTTDDFRAELINLQKRLSDFEFLLLFLSDGKQRLKPPYPGINQREHDILEEMEHELAWRIPNEFGGLNSEDAKAINEAEKDKILKRRNYYWPPDKDKKIQRNEEEAGKDDPNKSKREAVYASGLALSGGGIRSATFSLGVLVALARKGILPQFDYLSTVSGGGFVGSFLTCFLNSPEPVSPATTGAPADKIGLSSSELPFQRDKGEAAALRHIRHHSKYLTYGSWWGRVTMMFAQLYGMVINGMALAFVISALAIMEFFARKIPIPEGLWFKMVASAGIVLALIAIISLAIYRFRKTSRSSADGWFATAAIILILILACKGLEYCHHYFNHFVTSPRWNVFNDKLLLSITGIIPVIASIFGSLFGRLLKRAGALLTILAAISAPIFFFGLYLTIYRWIEAAAASQHDYLLWVIIGGMIAALVVLYVFLNINFTSPHRHYRNRLADAYLIQPDEKSGEKTADTTPAFKEDVRLLLSEIGSKTSRGPFHLINCALNVPASSNPKMQGRLTDFFLFSPTHCGSPLTRYWPTGDWEDKDPHLDLGTAMAISGAAAAPQMGLGTMRHLRFWLALLNIRLGYWAHHPHRKGASFGGTPGLWFLLKEMTGQIDENSPWLNLSDGGHIENLGVYELLRRRCKFIVAVDGEQDEKMTFAGLTNLQRLAAIDLGVRIHIKLDDLRLNEMGLSRSHFRFCRIEYPQETAYGYLLYVKLSLTGNEGEFLRRYRLDEPAFPHHSTADQFFSEAQFEAYRSLGEHVGDKLFLRAIVGDICESNDVRIDEWFKRLGMSLLPPI